MHGPFTPGGNGRNHRPVHPPRGGRRSRENRGEAQLPPTTATEPTQQILLAERRVAEAIVSGASLPDTLTAITTAIESQFPNMLCSILLLDETGTRLSCAAVHSLPAEYNAAIEGMSVGPLAGSCGTAVYRGEPVMVSDIANDPLWAEYSALALRHGLRACWSHPIVSSTGAILGTFAMYFREPRAPDKPELDMIGSAASFAAVAVERKRAEEQLHQVKERFELVLRATNDAVWDWNLATGALWWNENFQSLFGYRAEEIEPGIESWYSRLHPDDRERVVAGIHAVIDSGGQAWTDEYRFKRREGSDAYIYDRGFVIRNAQGQAVRMIGAMMDITERKRAEQALRESQSQLRMAIQASNVGLWDSNLDTGHVYYSPEWKSQLGYSGDEISNSFEEWRSRTHPDDVERVLATVRAYLEGRTPVYEAEFRMRHKNGSYRWIYARGELAAAGAGSARRMVGCHIDVTERKQAEEETARHAERQETVAALGQFALGHGELDTLMSKAAAEVARGLGVEYCKVLEHVPDENCVLLRARAGWNTLHPARLTWRRDQDSLESFCLRRLDAVAVADLPGDTRFVRERFEQEAGLRSGIAVVVHGDVAPYGVLSAHGTQPRRFSADEVSFVQSVANVLAAAIERKRAEERLAYLAQYDPLTGLPNRHLFRDRLARAIARAQRDERLVALLFLDLDQFKEINDTLGHVAGDRVLKEVGARLRDSLRADDTIARLGGDEFTVILEELTDSPQVRRAAKKILRVLTDPLLVDGKEFFVTASIGISVFPHDGHDGDSLLKHADIAMYQAKNEGRNTFQFYASTMSAAASDRVSLERSLRQALERGEFLVHYQPVVNLRSGRVVSLEALLRWQHPDEGVVEPARFLPLAEQTGLIVPIGEWVLHHVCAQSARWQQAGLPPMPIAVNVSARQFRKSNLSELVAAALTRFSVRGDLLELEITESLLMESPEATTRLLERVKQMGVHVALDDFGTGYSSFAYLKHFPLDVVKIDRSFVRDVTSDPDDAAIVTGMIELAHSLQLQLTAEGVETEAQVRFLRSRGCDHAQGYFFSRPRPAAELHELLRTGEIPGATFRTG